MQNTQIKTPKDVFCPKASNQIMNPLQEYDLSSENVQRPQTLEITSFPYLKKGLYGTLTPTTERNSSRSSLRNWKNSGTMKEQGYYGTQKGSARKRASGSTNTNLRTLTWSEIQTEFARSLAKIGVKPLQSVLEGRGNV